MEGETPSIRRLNSFLTDRFVCPTDIPADECLEEARHLAILWDKGVGWEKEAAQYLIEQFASAHPCLSCGEGGEVIEPLASGIPHAIIQIGRILSGKTRV